MKIRSFTISLLVSIVFSMNLTSCGALPASPTSTPPPTLTATPTATSTETPSPTESPLPPSDVRVAVGANQELLISDKDLTADWKETVTDENGKKEIKTIRQDTFEIVRGKENEILLMCQKAMYLTAKANVLSYNQPFNQTFEEFKQKIDANGGFLDNMYKYSKNTGEGNRSSITAGMVSLIPEPVNLNSCSITIHTPSDDGKDTRPDSLRSAGVMPGIWISIGRSNEGGIQVSFSPVLNRILYEFPFASKNLTPQQNAEGYSKTLAMIVENINILTELANGRWDDIIRDEPDQAVNIRVQFGNLSLAKEDLEAFFATHPNAGTEWLQVKK